MESVRNAGLKVDPADLPPGLGWEEAVWNLYAQISMQWRRVGAEGRRYALDLGVPIALMREMGWNVPLGIELLQVIEAVILEGDGE